MKEVSLAIDSIGGIMCSVASLIDYLAVQSKIKGPLFINVGKILLVGISSQIFYKNHLL